MHQLAPNALSHFYVPPHFIYLLFLFFLLFFMYQLIQIPFQNFSVFYAPTVPHPLLTFIPARPARIRTTTPPRHTKPHPHHTASTETYQPPILQTHHCTTLPCTQSTILHSQPRGSQPCSRTASTPAGRFDAVPTPPPTRPARASPPGPRRR